MSTRNIIIAAVVIALAVIAYAALTPDRGAEMPETATQGEAGSTQGAAETAQ